MFEHLKTYDHILVTGPQRSGTTICAKMISVDTGHLFLAERVLEGGNSIDYQRDKLLYLLNKCKRKTVIQCPSLSRWIHVYSGSHRLIVFMMRDVDDIQRSEQRIGWNGEIQKSYYLQPEYSSYHKNLSGPVSEIKYKFWEDAQKQVVENWLEVDFESLADHPLWVSARQRHNFSHRQISVDNRFASEVLG